MDWILKHYLDELRRQRIKGLIDLQFWGFVTRLSFIIFCYTIFYNGENIRVSFDLLSWTADQIHRQARSVSMKPWPPIGWSQVVSPYVCSMLCLLLVVKEESTKRMHRNACAVEDNYANFLEQWIVYSCGKWDSTTSLIVLNFDVLEFPWRVGFLF
jgi:hypothetical protein